ncbi:Rne/Rng family ribonuclease [Bradyrhizobium diazoefficiens]|nr:Rne/Rng family ribonuclease [Bradyrhizobium diazoefficiens]MBR0977205.1 Rne/Rng family ribonuclease [Bradyrhizobium diazoefficiens]MBR1005850.1 Rne/Rng family ribonuclease [Bradyrhizobium diazoefficiens]MBR1012323.1 Rne/Rng family ribonuclease [Bradyrhizobium diazoefficiens]MBR1049665.1 Rne/Rng family ribonuclease [Bradyrhizobium diazoefficiens]
MPNKMLIDATHPEETRVVVVRGNRVEEFDFETAQRKQLRGNIYLAKVTRVEPSLQAAFVEYGGNRHGFLAFSEIHPDYYQIPVADRQALIEAEEQAHREAEEESENRSHGRRRSRHRNARRRGNGERVRSEIVEGADPAAHPVEGEALPAHAEGASHEGEHLHADAEHHGEHEGHDHHGDHDHDDHGHDDHGHEDHGHDDHGHDDHHHADDDDHHRAHAHDAHGHDVELAHHGHDHDHADEIPAPVAAIVAETAAAPHEAAGSEAHAEALAEAVTAAAEPADAVYGAGESTEAPHHDSDEEDDEDEDDEDAEEEVVESVGGDDVLEEVPVRTFRPRRQYKIQEVIKRRQVMLVQVVKEERGNKGAALTTYLSLAGRYAVLMPNTARGGGISRKITSAQDRSRLKEVVQDLDVPEGMGIILRTAGAARTKPEIKRDFEYLIRMWETVRDLTLKSQAPTLVYEEGSLIKRSLRDLYNKEIDEISVAGEAGYREARDFMKMLMPANVSAVKQYRDGQPLFSRMGVESQLDAMFSPTVQLRSGGYIVINQTEALVSIDVNSGRSTREHHIEDTALKTNLEASEEVARQLRLRDLAGLIVIDFIDMDEKRNNRAVERKLSDCLRQDRARIQVGRISHFGLLEMSRQRIRASVLESSTDPCPHCGGTGHVRSVSSVALQLLRGLEEILMKGATHNLVVRTRTDVALYVLNHKRGHLRDLENGFKVTLAVIADPSVSGPQAYVIDRGEQVHTLEAAKALLVAQAAASPPPLAEEAYDDEEFDPETESEVETEETEGLTEEPVAGDAASEQDGQRRKRRRRRRGRGQRDGELREDSPATLPEPALAVGEGEEDAESEQDGGEDGEEQAARGEQQGNSDRRRRRGRRGGRRRRGGNEEGLAGSIADELGGNAPPEVSEAVADFDGASGVSAPSIAHAEQIDIVQPQVARHEPRAEPQAEAPAQPQAPQPRQPAAAEEEPADDKGARRRSTVREKVSFLSSSASEPATPVASAPEPVAPPAPEPAPQAATETPAAPRRAGWWSRRFGGGE